MIINKNPICQHPISLVSTFPFGHLIFIADEKNNLKIQIDHSKNGKENLYYLLVY
jgi:hypothetical protein